MFLHPLLQAVEIYCFETLPLRILLATVPAFLLRASSSTIIALALKGHKHLMRQIRIVVDR